MQPFNIPSRLEQLTDRFPSAHNLKDTALKGSTHTRNAIARLWLSEGIPFAFKDNPGIYDALRCWLSLRLQVNPKDINIQGSAKIGQSLSPHKLGKDLSQNSDLDLFIISFELFTKVKNEFIRWSSDFDNEHIKPRNSNEEKFWIDNIKRLPKTIERGFIDPHLIPSFERYELIVLILNSMDILVRKLEVTPKAFHPKSASIRIYKNWDAFVRQTEINLKIIK